MPKTIEASLSEESKAGYIIIDVLPAEQFEKVHILGAFNACVYEVTFLDQVKALSHDPEAQLLIYGNSAASGEAALAVEKLARAGYRNLTVLQGGIEAWQRAGRALAGEDTTAIPTETVDFLPSGRYTINEDESFLGWTGRNARGRHWGTVAIAKGDIFSSGDDIRGEFVVDMRRIDNIDLADNPLKEVLLKHLHSDDFFFTERFPTAVYTLSSAHPIPRMAPTQPNYHLKGELALRGVTAPLDFAATVNRGADSTWHAIAHFDLDRTRWQVLYGSSRFFAHLGMHKVFDLISLEIRLELRHAG